MQTGVSNFVRTDYAPASREPVNAAQQWLWHKVRIEDSIGENGFLRSRLRAWEMH